MTDFHTFQFDATARDAGRNVHHVVTVDGVKIGERRSAHRYRFAFVKRAGAGHYIITRWSRNGAKRGNEIAVAIRDFA